MIEQMWKWKLSLARISSDDTEIIDASKKEHRHNS